MCTARRVTASGGGSSLPSEGGRLETGKVCLNPKGLPKY